MPASGRFTFGPYELDPRSKQLLRDGTPVPLPSRHFDLLHALVRHAGEVLSKDALIQAAWPDVIVTDSSLAQATLQLRVTLDPEHRTRYIETVGRRGYRFAAPVARVLPTDEELDALVAPHQAFINGRAALKTLERAGLAHARETFTALVRRDPDEPRFHVGLANACVFAFETTRAESAPDADALRLAVHHAREARRLNPKYAEAWATLGFVLDKTGDRARALTALQEATTLEPTNWRHALRLTSGNWGEARLRAAERTLALLPGCPQAHGLAATVYIARDALPEAECEIDAGIAALPRESSASARFSAGGLHWLKGLVCHARGADDEAMAAFQRELAPEGRGHLYASEYCANTWYAIGALHLRRGDCTAALGAFEQARVRVPKHPMAHAGLALLSSTRGIGDLSGAPMTVDLAMVRAALLVAGGNASGAADIVAAALQSAPEGSAGWLIPVDSLLGVWRDRPAWAEVLAVLRTRAS